MSPAPEINETVIRQLTEAYQAAHGRLLLLDYDGTLTPFASLPQHARPSGELTALLEQLCADTRNEIYIISGRDADTLTEWLGHLPLHFIAEHGARKRARGADWQENVETDSAWKQQASELIRQTVAACPGSLLEEKQYSLAWHYRNAAPEEAEKHLPGLQRALEAFALDHELQVLPGHMVLELRQKGIHKGAAVAQVLEEKPLPFVLAIGDDRTDEDMFRLLAGRPEAYTIKVGNGPTAATFSLKDATSVMPLLQGLANTDSF